MWKEMYKLPKHQNALDLPPAVRVFIFKFIKWYHNRWGKKMKRSLQSWLGLRWMHDVFYLSDLFPKTQNGKRRTEQTKWHLLTDIFSMPTGQKVGQSPIQKTILDISSWPHLFGVFFWRISIILIRNVVAPHHFNFLFEL